MPRRLFNDKGFTAAEVLVAVAVLSIVLLGLTGMYVFGTRNMGSGGNRSRAAFFVHQKLEELRNSTAFPPAPVAPAAPASDNPAPEFTRTWVVSSLTGTAPSRIARVMATVSWTESTGPKSIQGTTYLPEP